MISNESNTDMFSELEKIINRYAYQMLADCQEVLEGSSEISIIQKKKIMSDIQNVVELALEACNVIIRRVEA